MGKLPADAILARGPSEAVCLWPHAEQCRGNRLYFGDNVGILASLLRDKEVLGKVRLVYIDPPFATQTMFHSRKLDHAYEDTLAGAEFVESLRERLVILHELMARDGSIYLHLDEKMIFHMKIVLDEIFGPENYRNCITRKKCNPKNYTRKTFGNVSDYILFYTKSESYVWNRPVEAWTAGRDKEYQYVEPETGRRFMKVPVHAPGVRNGATGTRRAEFFLLPENIGSFRRKRSTNWTPAAKSSGRQTAIRDARSIWTRARVSVYKISGWISATLTTRTSESLGIPPRRIRNSWAESSTHPPTPETSFLIAIAALAQR